jgi:hypothetical protein
VVNCASVPAHGNLTAVMFLRHQFFYRVAHVFTLSKQRIIGFFVDAGLMAHNEEELMAGMAQNHVSVIIGKGNYPAINFKGPQKLSFPTGKPLKVYRFNRLVGYADERSEYKKRNGANRSYTMMNEARASAVFFGQKAYRNRNRGGYRSWPAQHRQT